MIRFSAKGNGSYRASANGDPTCLDVFHLPQMHAFGGQLTALVQSAETPGRLFFATAKGLKTARLSAHRYSTVIEKSKIKVNA